MEKSETIIEGLLSRPVWIAAYIEIRNDSFSHAFGTQYYPDYPEVSKITYDRCAFTQQECEVIDNYISENYTEICTEVEKSWTAMQENKIDLLN